MTASSFLRQFFRRPLYTLLNVIGLSVGLSAAIIIYLWCYDELNYDSFQKNATSIYKIFREEQIVGGVTEINESTPANLFPLLNERSSTIKLASRYSGDPGTTPLLVNGEKKIPSFGAYVDSTFLEIFSFPVIEGRTGRMLNNPNSIVLTRSLARKVFGSAQVVGKTIDVLDENGGRVPFQVSGVLEDVPSNSSLQFEFLLSFDVLVKRKPWLEKWGSNSIVTYVMTSQQLSRQEENELNRQITSLVRNNYNGAKYEVFLYPFLKERLYSDFSSGTRTPSGRGTYVYLFAIIGLFILILASINYMNLSTSLAATRAREVGVKKVMGASRVTLLMQFLSEAFILVGLSLVLALVLAYVSLPYFNTLCGKLLTLPILRFDFVLMLLTMFLTCSLLSGIYPARMLASFKPAETLKNFKPRQKLQLQTVLVIIQFSIAVILVSASLVVRNQIEFLKESYLGYDKENIVYVKLSNNLKERFDPFSDRLLTIPGVKQVSRCDQLPFEVENSSLDATWPGKPENEEISVKLLRVDEKFLSTMGIKVVAGRDFDARLDERNYILNSTAAEALALDEPVGHEFTFWMGTGKIVGVTQDFHHASFYNSIDPMVLMLAPAK